ncbi:unnamed protein product [Caenorhabditis auriculariae]|uniref:BTB domain-containing protein n=1 Tax=Caenorhabditis auriculariae TaxID=2777116 RepID=A0A8S1HDB6_9PELO|nr:unnamed protein product [Caenorhabditis auriculariae]
MHVWCDMEHDSFMWEVDAEIGFWLKTGDSTSEFISKRAVFTAQLKPVEIQYCTTEHEPFDNVNLEGEHFSSSVVVIQSTLFSVKNMRTKDLLPQLCFLNPHNDSDLIILVERVPFHVHKQILQVYSSFFRELLSEIGEKKEIQLENATILDMEMLLNFIYPSDREVNIENVEALLILGKRFGVPSILVECDRFLCADPATEEYDPLVYLRWSFLYNLPDLQDHLLKSFDTVENISKAQKNWWWPFLGGVEREALLRRKSDLQATEKSFQDFVTMSELIRGSVDLEVGETCISGIIQMNEFKWIVKVCEKKRNVVLVVACDPENSSTPWKVDAEISLALKSGNEKLGTFADRFVFENHVKPFEMRCTLSEKNLFSSKQLVRAFVEIKVFSSSFKRTLDHLSLDVSHLSRQFPSVLFHVGFQKFFAHKELFKLHSSYFRKLIEEKEESLGNETDKESFEHAEKEKIMEIKLNDVSPNEIKTLIQAIYPMEQKPNEKNVEMLLKIGQRFGVPSILVDCDRFLISREADKMERFQLLRWSVQYDLPDLQNFVMKSFDSLNKIDAVRDSPAWLGMEDKVKSVLFEKMISLSRGHEVHLDYPRF